MAFQIENHSDLNNDIASFTTHCDLINLIPIQVVRLTNPLGILHSLSL